MLTTFQIADALFPSLNFCQRRLRTLYRLRLMARFRPQRADGGSYPYHWVIDQLGAEVVTAAVRYPAVNGAISRDRPRIAWSTESGVAGRS